MTAFRHITIGGVSFIGSTALGILLGSLDGCAHIGESRWLTERVDSKLGHSVAIDFSVDPPESWGHHCRVCGRRCPVLNPGFRARLAADPTRWYERIAHHIETDFLVSSDKSPGFLPPTRA
ncbi:MAG: hypothetical protein WA459_13770 [Stellaceae bacterium]